MRPDYTAMLEEVKAIFANIPGILLEIPGILLKIPGISSRVPGILFEIPRISSRTHGEKEGKGWGWDGGRRPNPHHPTLQSAARLPLKAPLRPT